jgi:hypothetical protein
MNPITGCPRSAQIRRHFLGCGADFVCATKMEPHSSGLGLMKDAWSDCFQGDLATETLCGFTGFARVGRETLFDQGKAVA